MKPGARIHAVVVGRYVSVLRSKADPKRLYCIDSICYHMGGPLTVGDIEDIGGEECVVCPWHHYAVTLRAGAKMYQSLAMRDGKMCPGEWKANPNQQRTHQVEVRVRFGRRRWRWSRWWVVVAVVVWWWWWWWWCWWRRRWW